MANRGAERGGIVEMEIKQFYGFAQEDWEGKGGIIFHLRDCTLL
jgi:hypothetical protein